ncbi:hypothetical protein CPB84DRAFT_1895678 [Gymnopilus junonius]|uniref:Uncharacterized protein n=1 Tax=Gymnopilus junonius TaxID=109634 RepID=A0A9P5N9L8_GYMJU|nr:hypothetical protein CPB84DRAFT_1895678 [Gymnopilus junonius]
MSKLSRFMDISDVIQEGLKNLQKWYQHTEDTEYICLPCLGSNHQKAYTEEKWSFEDHEHGVDHLRELDWCPGIDRLLLRTPKIGRTPSQNPVWSLVDAEDGSRVQSIQQSNLRRPACRT